MYPWKGYKCRFRKKYTEDDIASAVTGVFFIIKRYVYD